MQLFGDFIAILHNDKVRCLNEKSTIIWAYKNGFEKFVFKIKLYYLLPTSILKTET